MVPMFIGAFSMAIVPDRIGVTLNIDFLEKAALLWTAPIPREEFRGLKL